MCISFLARWFRKGWRKPAFLAVAAMGFSSMLFPQNGPTVRLSAPMLRGLTATVNGVTQPSSPQVSITAITWNWGDGTEPAVGWFPQTHTYGAPVIGFQASAVFANYEPVMRIGGPICGSTFLGASANTGYNASFSFDWVRMRPAPPANVMPRIVLGGAN
jgi:hypothetical protein